MSICQGTVLFRSIWNAFCPTFNSCAAYQMYKWSPGSMTTALWNVISLHEAGQRVWLHDDQGAVGDGDDYATHQFDNFTYLFFTGMKMSFASVTWQIFTYISGKDDDMGVLCYEEPSIWSLVLYGFFCCYGWPQTSEHAAVFACLFM